MKARTLAILSFVLGLFAQIYWIMWNFGDLPYLPSPPGTPFITFLIFFISITSILAALISIWVGVLAIRRVNVENIGGRDLTIGLAVIGIIGGGIIILNRPLFLVYRKIDEWLTPNIFT